MRPYQRWICFYLLATVLGCAETSDGGLENVPNERDAGGASTVEDGGQTTDFGHGNAWTTERVYQAMRPLCVSCHAEGHSNPYFESLAHFVTDIVGDEQYVVMGEPDQSALLALLNNDFDGPLTQMPPSGAPYSVLVENDGDKPNLQDLRDWIANLSALPEVEMPEQCAPTPAGKLLHRLNRLEYDRSVQALLGTSQSPANDFPSEDKSYGLDNIAQSLSVSPLLIEKYDLAAQSLVEEALPDPSGRRQTYFFEAEIESEMTGSVGASVGDGWNLWANGTLVANVTIASAGRYTLTIAAREQAAGDEPARASFLVDGQSRGTFNVSSSNYAQYQLENIELSAGFHTIGVEFLNDFYCPQTRFDEGLCGNGDSSQIGDRNLIVDWSSLEGPMGGGDTQSEFERRFLAACDLSLEERAYDCARGALERFARFAWRRPPSSDELARLWALAGQEFDQPNGLTFGMRQAIHALLLSPHFLFRVEQSGQPGAPLNGYERATRLAMFLWRQTPTEALLDRAEMGDLDTVEGVAEVTATMLTEATAMIDDLANQWLLLDQAALVDPDYELFAEFDETLRESMITETRLVFRSLFHEERSLLDLVNADFTFVDQRLAQHYGMAMPSNRSFERIELPNANRKGLLTHASWLSATSQRTRTSPVKRGKWVLEELLCQAPPPPPPSVEGLPEDVDQSASLRERLEQHRAAPECATCHTHMDAVGFGLEQFDAIGSFRTHDGEELIEPNGVLLGETQFSNATDMADAIRQHPNLGPCVTRKILTYAVGRGFNENEACYVNDVNEAASASGYDAPGLIRAIVTSPLFLNHGDTSDNTTQENQTEASQ